MKYRIVRLAYKHKGVRERVSIAAMKSHRVSVVAKRAKCSEKVVYRMFRALGIDPVPDRNTVGGRGELRVREFLKKRGLTPILLRHDSPWDIECGGVRIDVKTSRWDQSGGWNFTIHHGGALREVCDCYIFRLEKSPWSKCAIHLIVPAPVGVKGVHISMRSLLTRWGIYFNRFDLLVKRRTAEAA